MVDQLKPIPNAIRIPILLNIGISGAGGRGVRTVGTGKLTINFPRIVSIFGAITTQTFLRHNRLKLK
jgi:hypothetical protein